MDLAVEPLGGDLAAADRRTAWSLYVAIIVRPEVRGGLVGDDSPPRGDIATELRGFVRHLERIMVDWPAAEVQNPRATHLGYCLAAAVEMILLPFLRCLDDTRGIVVDSNRADWIAVRNFFRELARELSASYGFPDATARVPREVVHGWRRTS